MAKKSITFTLGTDPIITANADITATLSGTTVTFNVTGTVLGTGSSYWNYGVLLQCVVGKKDTTGVVVYDDAGYQTIKTISEGTWKDPSVLKVYIKDTDFSFKTSVTGCSDITDAHIKIRLRDNPSYGAGKKGTGIGSAFFISKLALSRGDNIASVTKTPDKSYYLMGDLVTVDCTLENTTAITGYQISWSRWSSDSSYLAGSPKQSYTFTIPSANVGTYTLTANSSLIPNTGTIHFHPNGGNAIEGMPLVESGEYTGFSVTTNVFDYEDTNFNIYNIENLFNKTGYHDTGKWSIGSANSETMTHEGSQDLSAYVSDNSDVHLKFFANWEPNTYNITYKPNGGVGDEHTSSHTYDKESTLSPNIFVRSGYNFVGWATQPYNAASYSDKSSVLNLTSENGGNITLYAVWEPDGTIVKKYVNARLMAKRDTETNWQTYNPVLLLNEVIVVDKPDGSISLKIGDGVNVYTNLPFAMWTNDTGWETLTLSSGVTARNTGGFSVPKYRKIGDHVIIQGGVTATSSTSESVMIGVLPEEYRPITVVHKFIACGGSRIARVNIDTAGQLKLEWMINISDGSKVSIEQWFDINIDYYI